MTAGPRWLGAAVAALSWGVACYLWVEMTTGNGLAAILLAWLVFNILSLGMAALCGLGPAMLRYRPRKTSFAC